MVFPTFNERTDTREEIVARGQKPYAGTTGPYAPAKTDPYNFKNQFASKLYNRNPGAKEFADVAFTSKSAGEVQAKIDSFSTDSPTFSPVKGDQNLAKDFAAKYAEGVQKGLLPADQAVNQNTLAPLMSQQPGETVNDGKVTIASRINYPGKNSLEV